jgi:hypothetical protein
VEVPPGLSDLLRTEAIRMAGFGVAGMAGLVPSGLLLPARLASVLGPFRQRAAQADQVQLRTSGRSSSSSTT